MDGLGSLLPVFEIVVILPVAIGLWFVLAKYAESRRMQRVTEAPLPLDECAACGSRDVDTIAPDVIRCRSCSIVGGDGVAAWQSRNLSRRFDRLSVDERLRLAAEQLRQAQHVLSSADDAFEEAASASVVDIAGLSLDRGQSKQHALGHALWQVREAHQLVTDSAMLLKASPAIPEPATLDRIALLLALDTGWLTDGVAVDVAVHTQIAKARKIASDLRAAIEDLLEHTNASHRLRKP